MRSCHLRLPVAFGLSSCFLLFACSRAGAAEQDNPGAAAWRRGVSLLKQGLVDAAVAQFTALVRYDPEDPVAYCYRAGALARKKDWQRVLVDAETALRLDKKLAWAHVLRGQAYAGLDKPQAAMAEYAEAIRIDPEFVTAYIQRGYLYAKLGQPDRANQEFAVANRLLVKRAAGGTATSVR